ncbi:hypothetical protein ACSQ67_022809 [Phaseolus vulgaris]
MLSIHDVVVVRYCDDKWFSSSVMLLQKGDAKSKPIVTSIMTMNGFSIQVEEALFCFNQTNLIENIGSSKHANLVRGLRFCSCISNTNLCVGNHTGNYTAYVVVELHGIRRRGTSSAMLRLRLRLDWLLSEMLSA